MTPFRICSMVNFAQMSPAKHAIVVLKIGGFMPRDNLQGSPPHDPLSEPLDVLLFDRTAESLEQENRWLKERLARMSVSNLGEGSVCFRRSQ
jgi:hypothetical protein